MTQESEISIRECYESFIDEVLDSEIIWGLSNDDGWATCDSNDFEGRTAIPFWSNEAQAKTLCVDDWSSYKATPIRFDDFIDAWLHGMHEDEVLAGINWDDDLVGPEVEPIMLIEDLIGEEDDD
jgi:hypothetical protein